MECSSSSVEKHLLPEDWMVSSSSGNLEHRFRTSQSSSLVSSAGALARREASSWGRDAIPLHSSLLVLSRISFLDNTSKLKCSGFHFDVRALFWGTRVWIFVRLAMIFNTNGLVLQLLLTLLNNYLYMPKLKGMGWVI